MRVAVVGAGLGGLSAAAHLVADGHDVVVYERSSRPGGLAAYEHVDGFRLDLGPTVLTMPDLIGETFGVLGADLDDAVQLTRLDPIYRAVFADGDEFRVRAGTEAMLDEIRRFAGVAAVDEFASFVDWISELYQLEMPEFVDTQWGGVGELIGRRRALWKLARLGGFRRLDAAVASRLSDERLRRVFGFQSMFAGVAPQRALAMHAMVTYLDTVAGVWAVEGGVGAVADALARRLVQRGARFVYDTPVSGVTRSVDGAVDGVELGGSERVRADAVVVNADIAGSYRSLLDVRKPLRLRRNRYAHSCIVWSAGVRGVPDADIAAHNVHFGDAKDDGSGALDAGMRLADPSTLVSVTSHADSTAAPAGSTSLFVLEPVPNLGGRVDWASTREGFGDELRTRAGGWGYPDDVVVERTLDPLDWRAMGLSRGTPFSLAHTFAQTGPLRPGNTDSRVPGLAFVGADTVPGVGVPMVVVSGRLAAARIAEHAAATRTVRW